MAGISSTTPTSSDSAWRSPALGSRSADRASSAGLSPRSDQVVLVRERDGGELRMDMELVQDVRDVVSHCDGGDDELRGDQRSAQAFGEALEYLFLPFRQRGPLGGTDGHLPERLLNRGLDGEFPLEPGLRFLFPVP